VLLGGCRSKVWRQMMADVFADVLIPEVYEAGFGAAAINVALGAINNLADVRQLIASRAARAGYSTLAFTVIFSIYERIYNKVVEEFSLLADYQRSSGGRMS